MIDSLRNICALLGKSFSARDLANRLGAIEKDYGANLQIVVRPSDPALTRAEVIRRPGNAPPSSVDVELAHPISVEALRSAFGDYVEPPRLHYDSPTEIVFSPTTGDTARRCAIIARIDGDGSVGDASVTHLTVQRESL